MVISITLTPKDLIELIESKISNEVGKHGHPGSFDVEIVIARPDGNVSPLDRSLLTSCEVRAVAHPKAAK